MNKHKVVFDILKNKILFFFKRCNYDNNKILASENLSFLSIIFIITRSFKFIVENDLNENNFDIKYSKDNSYEKRLTLILKAFREKMI